MVNISFNAIPENKILTKISELTVDYMGQYTSFLCVIELKNIQPVPAGNQIQFGGSIRYNKCIIYLDLVIFTSFNLNFVPVLLGTGITCNETKGDIYAQKGHRMDYLRWAPLS